MPDIVVYRFLPAVNRERLSPDRLPAFFRRMEKTRFYSVRPAGMAAAFDSDPVFTLENVIFLSCAETQSVYDESGATAAERLKNSIGELQPFVSDAFRARLGREMDAVNGQSI